MKAVEHSRLRWILPGLKVKRYILLIILGLIILFYALGALILNLTATGAVFLRSVVYLGRYLNTPYDSLIISLAGIFLIALSIFLIASGIKQLVVSISTCLAPRRPKMR